MRARALGFLMVGLLAGCSADWQPQHRAVATADGPLGSSVSADTALPSLGRASFASLPDRGDLLAYDRDRPVRQGGAYTWHPVELSEAHAMRAIAAGELVVTAPNGQPIKLRYERHVEHDNGNWTWIGRVPGTQPGSEAIITFGEKAAFGSIPYGDRAPLRLTIAGGSAWLIETDNAKLAQMHNTGTRPSSPDHRVPPLAQRPMTTSGLTSVAQMAEATATTMAGAEATTTVDVLLGYTNGFATRLGGQSQAVTRLTFLVDVTNQAYINSQIAARVRLVRTQQVTYPDATNNETALYELTGCIEEPDGDLDCDFSRVPASLQPLLAAQNQYGADLVSLVRVFNDPENDGCGIAWLLGAEQTPIEQFGPDSGLSVISDSSGNLFPDNGYICRDETLAHELGHNMGSTHDRETAEGDDGVLDPEDYGRYPYSFGHKTGAGQGNFYTVMAYGDSGQTKYRVFSNPAITYCGGFACGVTNTVDNARSLRQTIPIIATFRPTIVPVVVPPNLYAIAKQGASLKTEVHILAGSTTYQSFSLHKATALHKTGTGSDWKFRLGDYNGDGKQDLYAIYKMGLSGKTEVHVLNGADQFQTYLLHAATVLHQTGTDELWVFELGDYNADGKPDLYAINRQGTSGKTEVHILNGANKFQSYLLHAATALGTTGKDFSWRFDLGDYNRDGKSDLYCIARVRVSGKTEVHVLNGANGFQSFLLHQATALAQTGTLNDWDFKLGDFNRDSAPDVYAIKKLGTSGKTELHVLNGANAFQSYLLHTATPLGTTGSDGSWEFELEGS
jgi:hypothetical protein